MSLNLLKKILNKTPKNIFFTILRPAYFLRQRTTLKDTGKNSWLYIASLGRRHYTLNRPENHCALLTTILLSNENLLVFY